MSDDATTTTKTKKRKAQPVNSVAPRSPIKRGKALSGTALDSAASKSKVEETSTRTTTPTAPTRTTTPRTPTSQASPIDDDKWTEGEVRVITSDNVGFRVPGYRLRAASNTLLRQLPPGAHFNLTLAKPYETAAVFRLFLSLVRHWALTLDDPLDPHPRFDAPLVGQLFRFLKAHNCTSPLAALRNSLRSLAADGLISPPRLFIAASIGREDDLCRHTLHAYHDAVWPLDVVWCRKVNDDGNVPSDSSSGTPGKCLWDPAHAPAWFAKQCPPMYYWAMARAWGYDAPGPARQLVGGSAFSTTFIEFLEAEVKSDDPL